MNVSMNTAVQAPMHHRPPPNSEQTATRMAGAVANGDLDIEQLQKNLSERLGVEDTRSIVADDGRVDINSLTELLDANKPSWANRPPPPDSSLGTPSGSDMTQLLSNILGEEGLANITEEDGSYDVDTMVSALREQISVTEQSESGNLIDLMA